VQRVVGQVVLVHVGPDVLLRPLGERVELHDAALLVVLDVLRVGPRRRLLTAHPGDPGVHAVEHPVQRGDLALAAAVLGAGPGAGGVLHLNLQPVAVLHLLPDRVGLGEQDAGVDREHARLGLDRHQHVDQHRLLLLEGARQDQVRVVFPNRLLDDVYTAHSPSPRMTSKGTLRFQSMK
jgi:hypothetical protein